MGHGQRPGRRGGRSIAVGTLSAARMPRSPVIGDPHRCRRRIEGDHRMRTTAHPPVAAGDIEKLRSALVAALGAEAVTDDADALVEFRDPYWVRGSDDFDASLAVAPTSTEQVQQVVRLANEHGVPLWSFGQGRNNTYGGPAPRVRG